MSWLKTSDAAAHHPVVLAPLEWEHADDRLINELFGWVMRCAVQSAQHNQDYLVAIGTARAAAGSFDHYNRLLEAAIFAGYMKQVEVEAHDGTPRAMLKLVEEEDLFHMFLKSERDWQNQRKRDNGNESLTAPVRFRDGDSCRYCGKIVTFPVGGGGDRKSGRAGTYDHLYPGKGAKSADDMVVACRMCNSARGDDPDGVWRESKLMGPPIKPFYSKPTADFLRRNGYDVHESENRPVAIRADKRLPMGPQSLRAEVDPDGHQSSLEPAAAPSADAVQNEAHRDQSPDGPSVEPRDSRSCVDPEGLHPGPGPDEGDKPQGETPTSQRGNTKDREVRSSRRRVPSPADTIGAVDRANRKKRGALATGSTTENGFAIAPPGAAARPEPADNQSAGPLGPAPQGDFGMPGSSKIPEPDDEHTRTSEPLLPNDYAGCRGSLPDHSRITDRRSTGSRFVGSGRGGPGLASTGREPPRTQRGVPDAPQIKNHPYKTQGTTVSEIPGVGKRRRRRR